MNLNNYNGLFDHREHIQNIRNNLELVIQDTNIICKIFPITFYGSSQVWGHSIEPISIISFVDMCHKLIDHFSININMKKSSIKLFNIT
jgi:hypothetical protein